MLHTILVNSNPEEWVPVLLPGPALDGNSCPYELSKRAGVSAAPARASIVREQRNSKHRPR